MIKAKIFNRDTGECEVVFREGGAYEILAEHECWVPTIERWERMGITLLGRDDEGMPDLVSVQMGEARFPQALKQYIECQFNIWHVEVVTP